MKEDRISAIREHLFKEGFRTVQQISDAVDASVATIRRDLLMLESQKLILRSHGGARINENAEGEIAFAIREQKDLAAKRAIGEAAFKMIEPDSALFLDAGTTVLQVARRIRLNPIPVSVFTNCLTVAQVLMGVGGVKVTLIAGTLRAQNASMVGRFAADMLDRLWFDLLFLGAGAIAGDCCIYGLNEEEARLNEKMLSRARRTTLLADSSKFGHRLTYKVAPLTSDNVIITDAGLSPDWQQRVKENGCGLHLVASSDGTMGQDRA